MCYLRVVMKLVMSVCVWVGVFLGWVLEKVILFFNIKLKLIDNWDWCMWLIWMMVFVFEYL